MPVARRVLTVLIALAALLPATLHAQDLADARKTLEDTDASWRRRLDAAEVLMDTGKGRNQERVVDALFDPDGGERFATALLPVARPALVDAQDVVLEEVAERVRKTASSTRDDWRRHGLRLALALDVDGVDDDAAELMTECLKVIDRNASRDPEDRENTWHEQRGLDLACEVLVRRDPPPPSFLFTLQRLRESPDDGVRLAAYRAFATLGAARYAERLAEAVGDRSGAIRQLAVDALMEARRKELVPALVALVDEPGGPGEAWILPLLFRATGQRYLSRSQWEKWLEREGATFQVLTEDEFETAQEALVHALANSRYGPQGSFFSRPVESGHVVFVLDVSGSMSAKLRDDSQKGVEIFVPDRPGMSRMELVKQQVINALEGLTDQDYDLLIFSNDVTVWREDGNRAFDTREEALESAKRFIGLQRPSGGTAIHAGLEAAFRVKGVKEIFLLSDGQPSQGITDPKKIARDVRRWSKQGGGVALHCLAMGVANPLLEDIAKETKGGSYVEIEVDRRR